MISKIYISLIINVRKSGADPNKRLQRGYYVANKLRCTHEITRVDNFRITHVFQRITQENQIKVHVFAENKR